MLPDDFNLLNRNNDPEELRQLYADLRSRCPVAHSSDYGGVWTLTRHADIAAAAQNSALFISSVTAVVPSDPRGKFIPPFHTAPSSLSPPFSPPPFFILPHCCALPRIPPSFPGLRRPPLNFDAPNHTPFRTALDRTLKPARLHHLEERLRVHSLNQLQPMLDAGGGDIAAEFGCRFPAFSATSWLNLDDEVAPLLGETGAAWVNAWREQKGDIVAQHSQTLYQMARELVADRKVNPREPDIDPASSLLLERPGPNGEPLAEEHIVGALRQCLVVGLVAPPLLLASICRHLALDRDLQQELRDNLQDVPAAVEEFIRLYSPYRGFARTVKEPVTLHGRTINTGEPVTMTYCAANRDPEVFPDPDAFILHRPNISQHLGFGKGRHRCAGMQLARLMIQVAVHDLLAETDSIEMTGECQGAMMPELGYISCPVRLVKRS
ncbi:hypothetical protein JCM11251_003794 [Rhodosporidiobolus azoricus]